MPKRKYQWRRLCRDCATPIGRKSINGLCRECRRKRKLNPRAEFRAIVQVVEIDGRKVLVG